MGFGMIPAKKSPMTDKTKTRKPPKEGDDFDNKTRVAGSRIAPNMPDRDGPAKRTPEGGRPQKPKTSAKAASSLPDKKTIAAMKRSLSG